MKTVSQVKHKIEHKDSPIGQLRNKAGLSMREVAKYSGVSPATVCRCEAGMQPDVGNALLLARFFERSVEDLFGQFAKSSGSQKQESGE